MARRKESLEKLGGGRIHLCLVGFSRERFSPNAKISNNECFDLVLLEMFHFTLEI